MEHKETHTVTSENGPCPAGKPTECLYCHELLGEQHKSDCVGRQRTVVIEYRITVAIAVAADWSPDQINFHRNESSWCASNLIDELKTATGCLCGLTKAAFVREATEADDARFGLTDLSEK